MVFETYYTGCLLIIFCYNYMCVYSLRMCMKIPLTILDFSREEHEFTLQEAKGNMS